MDPIVSHYAALLALSEIAFGSFLHVMKVPLGGHALSLNQGVLLTLACRNEGTRTEAAGRANRISLVAAFFKALSPAGKRLTPMLAISVQGSLYAAGIFAFGRTLFGVTLGMALLSLWGIVQPVLVAYLLFGKALFTGLQKTWLEVAQVLSLPQQVEWWILGAAVVFKVILAIVLGAAAWRRLGFEQKYEAKIREWSEKFPKPVMHTEGSPKWRLILRDLTSAWFLIALAFQAGFFYFSGERNAETMWLYLLRPLAFGAIFFWAMRSVPRSFWERLLPNF